MHPRLNMERLCTISQAMEMVPVPLVCSISPATHAVGCYL